MSDDGGLYRGDLATFGKLNIDGTVSTSDLRTCSGYTLVLGRAAREAQERGDEETARAWDFVQALAGLSPNFDMPDNPYAPMIIFGDRRSLALGDLSTSDAAAIQAVAAVTKDPALRARLNDLLWLLDRKEHERCADAADAYIEAAVRLNDDGNWRDAETHFHRGIYLAGRLGKEGDRYRNAVESLLTAVRGAGEARACWYLELLARFGLGEPDELAAKAEVLAVAARSEGILAAARRCYELAADWHRRRGDAEAERVARVAAAETYVEEAELRLQGPPVAPYMAAATILQGGIEALRRAGGSAERVAELRVRLREYQTQSMKEMKTFSTEVDVADLVTEARGIVKSERLDLALFRLAFGHPLSEPARVREDVKKTADEFRFTYMFGANIVDHKGRTIARRKPLYGLEREELERSLEGDAFHYASRIVWPIRVGSFIEPARLQITSDHHPTFIDLLYLVKNNPFIPPGHEGIFLRGLHAGFYSDFVLSSHLLAPQIENSIRYVLESADVVASNIKSDGTEPMKTLGAILDLGATQEIFGEQLCFELRGCLIEKSGYGFRDRVAHGFVSEGDCYSHAAINLWWLTLRICMTPLFEQLKAKLESESSAPADE